MDRKEVFWKILLRRKPLIKHTDGYSALHSHPKLNLFKMLVVEPQAIVVCWQNYVGESIKSIRNRSPGRKNSKEGRN